MLPSATLWACRRPSPPMRHRPRTRRHGRSAIPRGPALALLILAGPPAWSSPGYASGWAKVDPRDPALAAPAVSPTADAEVILWEITVVDRGSWDATQSEISHHLRIKVFNERGRDALSRVDIPYRQGLSIGDFAARTIQPDGSVFELQKKALFDRTILKSAGVKVKAKSFVFPAARPGSMLEYRYTVTEYGGLTHHVRVPLQREIPVRRLVLRIKPLVFPGTGIAMRFRSFSSAFPIPKLESDGYATSVLTDIRAFEEEPYMPPHLQSRGFVLLYYGQRKEIPSDEYWRENGRTLERWTSDLIRPRGRVRKAVEEACSGAITEEDRLRRIYAYCTSRIRNVDDDASGLTDQERSKLKDNKDPGQTLGRGMGTSWDINAVFAAMARASGFDARIAFLANKSEVPFSPGQKMVGLLTETCVAVRLAEGWRFFDPGLGYAGFGKLPWWLEGQDALIPDHKESVFVRTPQSTPEESLTRRAASLHLTESGSLEGDAWIEAWGHEARGIKEEYDDASPAGRADALRDGIREQIPDAEVTRATFRHVRDDTLPVVVSYHIRVPAYAQRAGSRIFLSPDLFEEGRPPLFTAEKRRYPVKFAYGFCREDSVTIFLPESMEIDAMSDLAPVIAPGFGRQRIQILVAEDGRRLCLLRSLRIGEKGSIEFPATMYAHVKEFFDRAQALCAQKILLRPAELPPR
jgi:hypothetical protein